MEYEIDEILTNNSSDSNSTLDIPEFATDEQLENILSQVKTKKKSKKSKSKKKKDKVPQASMSSSTTPSIDYTTPPPNINYTAPRAYPFWDNKLEQNMINILSENFQRITFADPLEQGNRIMNTFGNEANPLKYKPLTQETAIPNTLIALIIHTALRAF